MDIKEMIEIIEKGSETERLYLFSHLCDVFESYNKNIFNFREIVELLIDYVAAGPDDDAKSEALEAICNAQTYQDTEDINFDKIEVELSKINTLEFKEKFIEILGYTHNKKYLETILRFKDHGDRYVKKAVEDALIEMGVIHL